MSRRKHKTKAQRQVEFLTEININNTKAREEGPIKKKWTTHDLTRIKALTPAQEDLFHGWYNEKHLCAHGTAGTGKTFLAFYLAFQTIFDHDAVEDHIIIVRSNVSTREIGHLPGDIEEKLSAYETPYMDICEELFGRATTYDDMKAAGVIHFQSTSFIRGLTWDNAVVIVEEGQNMSFHEINSIMTRIGVNTRVIFTGDTRQSDLFNKKNEKSGMPDFLNIVKNMEDFESIQFTRHDIVRSEFVKSWIIATENLNIAA